MQNSNNNLFYKCNSKDKWMANKKKILKDLMKIYQMMVNYKLDNNKMKISLMMILEEILMIWI